jgi:hypothetical protein
MNCSQRKTAHSSNKEIAMANMKKADPALAKQAKKDIKFLKEKVVVKPTVKPKAPAKTTPKMTPQDAAMKKLLEKKYGKIYG